MMSSDSGGRGRRGSGDPSGRSKVAALVFIALLIGALFWAVQAIVQHNAVQNCIDSGRHDCVPIPGNP
jgi:hypothetical protein